MSTLGNILAICLMVIGLTTMILLMAPKAGDRLQVAVQRWRHRNFEISASLVVQAVLRMTIGTLDLFVSPDLPRRVRAKRVAVGSLLVLIGAFGLAGLLEGKAFGVSQPPWTAYSMDIERMLETHNAAENPDREAIEQLQAWSQWHWVVLYTILSTGTVIVLSILGDYFSLRLSRSVLTGLLPIRSQTTLLVSFVGLTTILLVISCAVFMLVACSSSPYLVGPMILAPLFIESSSLAGTIGILGTLALAMFMVRLWVWAVAATAILPGLFVLTMWAIGAVAALIVHPFSKSVGHLAELAFSHRLGVIGFILALLSAMATMLGGALYFWPGN